MTTYEVSIIGSANPTGRVYSIEANKISEAIKAVEADFGKGNLDWITTDEGVEVVHTHLTSIGAKVDTYISIELSAEIMSRFNDMMAALEAN